MTYSVIILDEAKQDLRGIYWYIAYMLQSVQKATAQIDRLQKSIRSLDQMPERYRRYEIEPWHSRGWRIMPVDRYCVFYMVDHDRGIVEIQRVLDGRRNITAALNDDESVEKRP